MKQVIEAIKKHRKFLITAHVNLEGDSIGSQLAMKELLKKLGKTAFILDSDPVPEHYKFLPKADEMMTDGSRGKDFEVAMVLDCPTLKRTGSVGGLIGKEKVIVNIDHHISNEKFGTINWVDPNASSTGEMIYKLFKKMKVPVTKEIALSLYIAILTDTGSFNYENTSSVTHEIAGELLNQGLEPASISERVYEQRCAADVKLLAMVLSSLRFNDSGEIALLEITNKMINATGADASRSEGFVNFAKSIDTVKVALLFREEEGDPGKINVSFRAKGNIDVNRIAARFGGGGHMRASGCIIMGDLREAEAKVLREVERVLNDAKDKDQEIKV